MTSELPLRFLFAFVFLGTRSFFKNFLKDLAPPLVASIMAKFEHILWERFQNILKQSFKGYKNTE